MTKLTPKTNQPEAEVEHAFDTSTTEILDETEDETSDELLTGEIEESLTDESEEETFEESLTDESEEETLEESGMYSQVATQTPLTNSSDEHFAKRMPEGVLVSHSSSLQTFPHFECALNVHSPRLPHSKS